MAIKVFTIECGYSSSIFELPYSEKTVVDVGDEIIFKNADGREEYGIVKMVNVDSSDPDQILFTSKILRKATANDIQKVESHIDPAKNALKKCAEVIANLGVDMYAFRAGYSFDGAKVHFLFTAEDRVDFRDLVKELAKILQKQIHLRQIGPRDKAKLIGGFGKCGRPLCCSTWLGRLESINMEMVRAQALESKGSAKLSGACGKLLCCLKYEVDAYKDLRKNLPYIGSTVKLKKNKEEVKIIALDILNQKVKVVLNNGESLVIGVPEIII